ncbi:MAG: M23 family metallopeptidase [Candidatus Puniceispirillum sp.]|jgi:murein DD-endopeptidase MepM/ murein hydrolase activator NlpD|uniref:M23 family metallopeptidase n=1 Tax=Candidatus Puniceispirillum sp. TaxID=2026719 RepID=UPI001EC4CBF8|nr:M23 family metallopeptidase [Candidatus Puniceispirillum sp.]MBT6415384.1 M23 family metallopeptidase [Candidatus Puniceispirillum sp.]MBT6565458.1 M23 family metallopeptidase [Candidatus Puniceispirillum sp.]
MNYPRSIRHSYGVLALFFVLVMTVTGSASLQAQSTSSSFAINGADVISGYPLEGHLIIARTAPDYKVTLDGADVSVTDDGLFVIGFHRDSDDDVALKITDKNGVVLTTILSPAQRDYNIQRIDGLKQSMVTPPKAVLDRIKADSKKVREARIMPAPLGDFWRGLDWPVLGRISGVFGSQRILNGKPRAPHYGIDIAAPAGTPIHAPASGTITLAYDLYYSGLTVILNHGLGVNSTFLHLQNMAVTVGDQIERGDLIGTLGSTGRSTGPHLDWRLDWQGRRIDAQLIAGPMPAIPKT